MRIFQNGFIGQEPNRVSKWSFGDNEVSFEKNRQTMPIDWYYNNVEIIYRYNSNGHRSKEISELDLDNYILCLGCSHTEGVGMEEDKIYPALLAKKLNCDYYNMGIGATGMDVVMHNLVVWFKTIPKKPKAVIIQTPTFTRVLTGNHPEHLKPTGWWSEDEDYGKFVNLGIDLEYFEAKRLLTHSLIKTVVDVPTVYFSIHNTMLMDSNTIIEKIVDHARDLGHPGIQSHENFAEAMHNHLINTGCLNFYQNTEQKN